MYFTGSLLQSIDWVFKPGDSKSQPRGWKMKSQGQKLHSEHELRSQRLKNAILRFQFQRSGFWRSEKSTYMNRLLVHLSLSLLVVFASFPLLWTCKRMEQYPTLQSVLRIFCLQQIPKSEGWRIHSGAKSGIGWQVKSPKPISVDSLPHLKKAAPLLAQHRTLKQRFHSRAPISR